MPLLTLSPGLTLHYRDENPHGTPAVLLLHGLGSTGSAWQEHISWLAGSGYRVLAPDMRRLRPNPPIPGTRASPPWRKTWRNCCVVPGQLPPTWSAFPWAGRWLNNLPWTTHRWCAPWYWSIPSPACARTAFVPGSISGCALALVYTLGRAQARLVGRYMFPRPDQEGLRRLVRQVASANPRCYRATMRALGSFDVEKRLGEIHVPTLVITEAQDSTVSPKNQQLLVEGIPGARQVAVANANHAVPADQPAAFQRILAEFLEAAGGPAK